MENFSFEVKEKGPKKRKIFFYLEKHDDDLIKLMVKREVDAYSYAVLHITPKGIERIESLPNDLGFETSIDQKIAVNEY